MEPKKRRYSFIETVRAAPGGRPPPPCTAPVESLLATSGVSVSIGSCTFIHFRSVHSPRQADCERVTLAPAANDAKGRVIASSGRFAPRLVVARHLLVPHQ